MSHTAFSEMSIHDFLIEKLSQNHKVDKSIYNSIFSNSTEEQKEQLIKAKRSGKHKNVLDKMDDMILSINGETKEERREQVSELFCMVRDYLRSSAVSKSRNSEKKNRKRKSTTSTEQLTIRNVDSCISSPTKQANVRFSVEKLREEKRMFKCHDATDLNGVFDYINSNWGDISSIKKGRFIETALRISTVQKGNKIIDGDFVLVLYIKPRQKMPENGFSLDTTHQFFVDDDSKFLYNSLEWIIQKWIDTKNPSKPMVRWINSTDKPSSTPIPDAVTVYRPSIESWNSIETSHMKPLTPGGIDDDTGSLPDVHHYTGLDTFEHIPGLIEPLPSEQTGGFDTDHNDSKETLQDEDVNMVCDRIEETLRQTNGVDTE